MNRFRTLSPSVVAMLALVFALSTATIAQKKENHHSNVKIKNFGQMDERFFRGARPKAEDLKALASLGVTTIIDLTDNSREYEQPAVEAASCHTVAIVLQHLRHVGFQQRPAERASADRRDDFLGAQLLVVAARRVARENLLAARRGA